jgi:hypothetical protein
MEYEKILESLRIEIESLNIASEIKSPLNKIEVVLRHLYEDFLDQKEDKIRLKVNEYISNRTKEILDGQTPIKFEENIPKLILQMVPFNAFKFESHINEIEVYSININDLRFKPVYITQWDNRVTPEGLLTFSTNYGYTQIFRSGIVEAVDKGMLSFSTNIPSGAFEKEILQSLEEYQKLIQQTGITGKWLLKVQLEGIQGFKLVTENAFTQYNNGLIVDRLVLPEILLEDINDNIEQRIKPAFDYLWRAFGYTRSLNYENGAFLRR